MPCNLLAQAGGRPTARLRSTGGVLRRRFAPMACVVLAACNTPIGTDLTRATARSVVNPIVAEQFPGVPLQPTTDCVINNATSDEILTLAASAATQDEQTAVNTVFTITQRPSTIRCIATDGVPVLLDSL